MHAKRLCPFFVKLRGLLENRKQFKIPHWKVISILLVCFDIVAIAVSYFLALLLRFDFRYGQIPNEYLNEYLYTILPYIVFCIAIFWAFRLYSAIWRFASYRELINLIISTLIDLAFYIIGTNLFVGHMPISYYVFGIVIQFILTLGIRFSYRFMLLLRGRNNSGKEALRIMIIGAGSAGQMIQRDMKMSDKLNERTVVFIDDNPNKWNRSIDGVPVAGGRDAILENVQKFGIDKIYLAIPGATAEQRRDILNICKETSCELKTLPGLSQIINGEASFSQLQAVSVDDLLGREPIKPDLREVFDFINGKTVLVTGGGGSIGSELCRQIAAHSPKQLIIFDVYENNAYDIQNELRERYPYLNLVTLIGSVRDSRRMFAVFSQYKPQIVYHAAAHKHVPLMEDSPTEAIKNNAIGTYKTAYAAMVNGCERFVLISTDKAVNPVNIMGASKRLCEMVIQSFDTMIKENRAEQIPQLFTHEGYHNADKTGTAFKDIKTQFVAVRFGNVLGSNGSVIPIFEHQIKRGGPVTVTHPDIIRYFMTIPEAVSLVLLAGTYAKGGEIFVLDMGSPVKIDTLARNMIRLSGYTPDVDIKIEYTGLRPGEKLYEEKLMAEEGMKKTANKMIHIGVPIPLDTDRFFAQLGELMDAAYKNRKDIREMVRTVVDTYKPEQEGEASFDDTYAELVSGEDN